jgi:ABC-type bacteriocin/lantibiotic exporter with double-glycine peptidase domain
MVLSGFGLDLTEERLRELCDCSPLFGTEAMRAVDAARKLGFTGTAKYTLRYDELRGLIEGSRYPIAYLSLESIGGTEESHAVVVIEAEEETVMVYDPLHGERRISGRSHPSPSELISDRVTSIDLPCVSSSATHTSAVSRISSAISGRAATAV